MTGQHIVGTKEGWGLARSLRRVVPELQRNVGVFNEVRGAPWDAGPRETAEAEKVHVAVGTQVPAGDFPPEQPTVEPQQRDVKLRRNVDSGP